MNYVRFFVLQGGRGAHIENM